MKKMTILFLLGGMLSSVEASLETNILYSVDHIAGNRWRYTYEVQNTSFAPGIEQFTIWFELGLYENIQEESSSYVQSDWIENIWQPEPLLLDNGKYDAKALTTPVSIANNYLGFSVSFDWLRAGTPGAQYYEIIDPTTFVTMTDGYTVIPEPVSMFLLSFGGLLLLRKNACKPSKSFK